MSRTLLTQSWSFHTARVREPKRQDYAPSALSGVDLLDFVRRELEGLRLTNREKQRWTSVRSIEAVGTRALLVTAGAGAYNEPGDVVNVDDGTVDFTLNEKHAATTVTRSLIVVPDVGLNAVAFYERSTGRGTSGLDLARALQDAWRSRGAGITWRSEWLEESDAWLQAAKLKAVQIRRYVGGAQTADADAVELGEYQFGAKAAKNRYLPHRTLEQILDDPKHAHELIGHGLRHEDGDRVFVELTLDGQQKTYALDGGRLPKVQLALKDDLDNMAFVAECAAQARDRVFPGLGVTWTPAWVEPPAA